MIRIRIKKLQELPNALHPNNIEVGFETTFEWNKISFENGFREPEIGKRFYAGYCWSTSGVQEIVDDKTFKTYSSIYEWEVIKE